MELSQWILSANRCVDWSALLASYVVLLDSNAADEDEADDDEAEEGPEGFPVDIDDKEEDDDVNDDLSMAAKRSQGEALDSAGAVDRVSSMVIRRSR